MNWLHKILPLLPAKRLTPDDGMSVTIDAWNDAHNYHNQMLRSALLATGGWGIIDGLAVTLNETDPLRIHVGAGIAIDPEGRLLLFHEDSIRLDPQSMAQATSVGVVYLVVQFEEARLLEPHYTKESCRLLLETTGAASGKPVVEVARIHRSAVNAPVKLAANPDRPGKDELDLRFRLLLGAKTPIYLALVKVDGNIPDEHFAGWRGLAREVAYTTARPILIDEWDEQTLPPTEQLRKYQMICLVGREHFTLNQIKRQYLYDYVQQGGMLFYESCRQNIRGATNADKQFQEWINGLARPAQLQPIASNDPLSLTPYLFRRLPRGYEDSTARDIKITRAIRRGIVLYSGVDYGCAFAGRFANNNLPTRSELRETLEWGHNLLALAAGRAE